MDGSSDVFDMDKKGTNVSVLKIIDVTKRLGNTALNLSPVPPFSKQ